MIYAFVGSGGKTTAIFRFAQTCLAQNKTVLITTTTHLYHPASPLAPDYTGYSPDYAALNGSLEEIRRILSERKLCLAGLPSSSQADKITALPPALYEAACRLADVVLVEADGSRGLPCKFPSSGEPAVPANTDQIVVVTSLTALSRPISQVCHRPEAALSCLRKQGISAGPETPVVPAFLELWLQEGYLRPLRAAFPVARVRVLCTQAHTLYERILAALLEAEQPVSLLSPRWFQDAPHLILLGAGHVSRALAQIAALLSFRITVCDDRSEFLSPDAFPPQTRLLCQSFSEIARSLPEENNCFYAVLTRGHQWDKACVSAILSHSCPPVYLGMIGSRTKVRATFDALLEEGFCESQLASIHAPIGLKIGGQTPAEIAVSIAAELVQVRNENETEGSDSFCSPDFLKQTAGEGVCAVITHKKGSAPRGAGSMMFLSREGSLFGTIGGGAMEYEVITQMKQLLAHADSTGVRLLTCDVSASQGAALGMICGGQVEVLLACLR